MDKLLDYVSGATGYGVAELLEIIASDTPGSPGSDVMDKELLELWPSLSPDARLMFEVVARLVSDSVNDAYDRVEHRF